MFSAMRSNATIAGARSGHNRLATDAQARSIAFALSIAVSGSTFCLTPAGCATGKPSSTELPVWQLALSEPVKPRLIARARVRYDKPLPVHLTQPLCDEFALITITEPADWADVQSLLHLDPVRPDLDLDHGAIIGIQANVGEYSTDAWPIRLQAVRTRSAAGWVEAWFAPGLYYPLSTAGYLELVYVLGLRTVRRVEISPGSRSFIIRRPSEPH